MKKEPSGPSSVEVEVEFPVSTQSEAERQSAEAELSSLIVRFAPANRQLIDSMRGLLRTRLPTAFEVVYEYRAWFVISYSPNGRGYEGVLSIRASADGVKLYLSRGNELPDPERLLKGSAQVRFIHVDDASILERPAVSRLIDEAIARTGAPFANAGRGSVVIRPAAARQRRPA